jgi:hypothetical protein
MVYKNMVLSSKLREILYCNFSEFICKYKLYFYYIMLNYNYLLFVVINLFTITIKGNIK